MPVILGEKRSCLAQTEAEAGSDPAAMRTTAVRDGDHYVINGVKRFITGADIPADGGLVDLGMYSAVVRDVKHSPNKAI